jgi:hypothetical protein
MTRKKPPRMPANVRRILQAEGYGTVRITVDEYEILHAWCGDREVSVDSSPDQLWFDLVADARFPKGSAVRREFYDLVKRLREAGKDLAIVAGEVPAGYLHERPRGIVARGRTGAEMLDSLRSAYPELA